MNFKITPEIWQKAREMTAEMEKVCRQKEKVIE